MKRCLSERALLRLHLNEATAAERLHLQRCADCTERYGVFIGDLAALDEILSGMPPAFARRHVWRWRLGWVPVVAVAALVAVVVSVTSLHRPAPMQLAVRSPDVSAFAADVSDALFASADAGNLPQADADAPYLGAAFEAGWPCTQDRYLNGDCNDQLSALLFAGD